ncbi:hypothetical protein GCM10027347_61350 [Larkinella harenae]
MAETLLLRLEYDEAGAREKIIALNKEMLGLKGQQAELNKQFKEGKITAEQYAEKNFDLGEKIKKTSNQIKDQGKALDEGRKASKLAIDSIKSLSAATDELVTKYQEMSRAQRESAEGKALVKQIIEQRTELGRTDEAISKTRKTFREMVSEYEVFGVSIEGIKTGTDAWITSLKGAQLGLTGIKAALAASGIGLLVVILGSLIAFLTKSQEGMDLLSRKMAGVSAVVSAITSRFSAMGKAIIEAIDKPGEAFKKFGDFLQNNVINRLNSFKVIWEGIRTGSATKLLDGVVQFGTGITDATKKVSGLTTELNKTRKAGEAVALESQKIRDLSIQMEADYKLMRGESERLKQIADDTTKSFAERNAAIRKAGTIEVELQSKREAFQLRIIKNLKEEARLNGNNFEDKKKVAEAERELGDIREDRYERGTEIQNTYNSLVKEQAEKQKELAKSALQAQIGGYELLINAARKAGRETLKIEEDLILARAKLDKKNAATKRERDLIDAQAAASIVDLRTGSVINEQQRFFKIRESNINAELALVKRGTEEEAKLMKSLIANRAAQDRIATVSTITNAKERAARLKEIDASEKAQKLAVDNALKAQLAQNDVAAIQARLNAVREGTEAEFDLRKEMLDAQLKEELANVDLSEEQKAEVRSRYQRAQDQLAKERILKDKENDQIRIQTRLNATIQGSKEEYDIQTELLQKQLERELELYKDNQIKKDEIQSAFDRIMRDRERQRDQQFIDNVADIASRATAIFASIFEAQRLVQEQAFNEQQDAALKSAGNNAELRAAIEEDYQKKREQLEKEGAEKRRRIARVEALINTGVAVTKALTGAPPPFNAILAAVVAAQGIAQQVLIDQQKFAQGGVYSSNRNGPMVKGPGTGTSDSINAKLSNGESVNTAKATSMFGPLLSFLNQLGGGRAYPGHPSLGSGYTVPLPSTITNYATGGVYNQIQPQEINYDKLASALGAELRANPIITKVVDINTAQSNVQVRESRHDNGFGS